jgi:two-component system NtrC family response regulator
MAGRRILVVDGNDRARKLLGETLSPLASHLYLAKEGAEALDRARAEPFDIVFADHQISGRDGISLLWDLRRHHSKLSAVLMAVSPSIESAIEAIRSGVADYLVKPLTPQKVIAAFERATKAALAAHRPTPQRLVAGDSLDAPVAVSDALRQAFELARRCASLETPVVLGGEYGVGKETLARTIHRWGARATRPFVKIECSEISDRFMQSVLFGHEGASSSADVAGRAFEAANGGTLFLNDVDALPRSAKCAIIEMLELQSASADSAEHPDAGFHLIVATTKPSPAENEQLKVCRAILDRAGGVLIQIPPLRERVDDIQPLAERFLHQLAARLSQRKSLTGEAMECLLRYAWPGNARQLQNAIRHSAYCARGETITRDALPAPLRSAARGDVDTVQVPLTGDFRETQRQLVRCVVTRFDGNKTAAAKALGLNRRKLYRLLDESAANRL